MNKTLKAIAALIGTTIGAGIFGIPFVVSKVGFSLGLFYLLILGGMNLVLNLIYGEVILRTPGDHQLTGYGEIYLGKKGKILATITLFISIYGALLAYLIKIGEFASIFFGIGSPVLFSCIFFVLCAFAIFFGLRLISSSSVFLVLSRLVLILLLFLMGASKINFQNFSGMDFSGIFLPFGVILFALNGAAVIPEMEEILRKEHQNLKKSIIIGSLVPLSVYLLFAFLVVGISGGRTSDDAILGLVHFLSPKIINLGALLGVLNMAGAFLILGYVLREVWFRDFKLKKIWAFCLACFPSLLLFLLGARMFIKVLGFTGALAGGLNGILILTIFNKAKKQGKREPAYFLKLPEVLIFVLYLIFFLGMLSPFLNFK